MTIYDDLLITAVEGGSNYWADFAGYRHGEHNDTTVTVTDVEDEGSPVTITTRDIEKACRAVMTTGVTNADPGSELGDDFRRGTRLAIFGRGDQWDFDATHADAILQLAVLGEVTYG